MRIKRFIPVAVAAAALIAPAASSGCWPRCEAPVATNTTVTTATFTATQPANGYHQWDNLWTHDYTVIVQPDGSFVGTGVVNGHDSLTTFNNEPQSITGSFDADKTHVSFDAIRTNDGVEYALVNAPTDNTTLTSVLDGDLKVNGVSVTPADTVEFKVSKPVVTTATTTTPVTES